MKRFLVLLMLLFSVFIVSGCEENGVIPTGIVVSSENNVRTITVNESLQLSVVVYPNGASKNVKWSSSDESVATVDENGLVFGVSEGNVQILCVSKLDENVKQSYAIIVNREVKEEVVPQSVVLTAVNNITTCKAGETIKLEATVYPEGASQSVEWTSSDVTVATVGRGEVKALKEGSVVITVNAKGYADVKSTITLTFEPSDNPTFTKDWPNMPYNTHEEYMSAEDETPLKVKGVVTHILNVKDNQITYVVQNGKDGYYIYAQDNITYPVELGKSYEIGGFKKYYRGLQEIVDIEFFGELEENITYTVNNIDELDASSLSEMAPYHSSLVSGKAILKEAEVNGEKAYSFTAEVNGKETTFRVDPSYTGNDFSEINKILTTAVAGSKFEFTGLMTAFGYGTASPQVQVLKASNLKFAELSNQDYLEAISDKLAISTSIAFNVDSITLPTKLEGFDGVEINWSTDSDLIDVNTGKVSHSNETTTVVLKALLSYKDASFEVLFDVVVFAEDNKEYEVLVTFDCEDALAGNSYGNSESKPGYAEGVVELGTPKAKWLMRNALIAAIENDVYDGIFGIRAKSGKSEAETGRLEIMQDGEYNVVELDTAIYGNDKAGIQIAIEYSTDSGATWVRSEQVITVDSKTLQTYRVVLPEGAKRVAIVVVANSGNRVNIDNIKLMK